MDFHTAKALLIENAVGENNYDEIITWSDLAEAADFEMQSCRDRIRQLQKVESVSLENDDEQRGQKD